MEIISATKEHIEELYGKVPVTVRALSAIENGKCYGVAGFYKIDGKNVAFVKIKDEMKFHKRLIVLAARKLLKMANGRIYAIQDKCFDTSEGFLRHFGFEELKDGVFVCQTK